jgi:hypothetical protein
VIAVVVGLALDWHRQRGLGPAGEGALPEPEVDPPGAGVITEAAGGQSPERTTRHPGVSPAESVSATPARRPLTE